MTSLPKINNDDSSSTTTHLKNLLLETLMKKIQLHDPDNVNDDNNPSWKSFEDFLFGSNDDEDDAPRTYQEVGQKSIHREESRIEGEIIKLIVSGEGDTLKPNFGEADFVSKGLKDLIDDADTDVDDAAPARILHRSLNAGSARPRSTIWVFFVNVWLHFLLLICCEFC